MARKNSPGVFEIASRVVTGVVVNDLASHQNKVTTDAHQISNISGLETALNGKQDVISGYTGTIDIVTGVNFATQTVTSKTVNVSNGIITSIA